MFRRTTPKIEKKNAVSELRKIIIGGVQQWLLIRGENKDNPLLLMLHGGPGGAQIGFIRDYQKELEKHCLVVNWDQRGAGLSYSRMIPSESMNINQFVNDLLEVIAYLKKEFKKEKIFLLGHSWGSFLGMITVAKYPELFYHFFGVSQVVSLRKAEELSYELVLGRAKEQNSQEAIKKLEEIGKPPWASLKQDRIHQKYVEQFGGGMSHDGKLVTQWGKKLLTSKEYTIFDTLIHVKGQLFSIKAMLDELRESELSNVTQNVKVPVSFYMGKHDLTVPPHPTQAYFKQLEAPSKEWVWFENSAHCPNFEEREKFTDNIIDTIRRYDSSSSSA